METIKPKDIARIVHLAVKMRNDFEDRCHESGVKVGSIAHTDLAYQAYAGALSGILTRLITLDGVFEELEKMEGE